ncbi:helix-turn-helix transcriptional regulator [Mycolicibacterium sp. HK-90]|uniref:helix-turn-helix transcriptional regulator n=1 Tax=Mycolicibacterium sp. HK-90 TaxID=3056937 RepID=UPI00265B469D|nr:helix-turn-helix transcriptional regulator [Mycolicibacterium sp. HK-90]WKG04304.1 helix-turn-helix transcriptional regulator [Mycolicibacterium sp. HK-90]
MGQFPERIDPVPPHPSGGQRNWLIAAISATQPHRDDLWLIPADQRFAARRSVGTIARVVLPTRVIDGTAGQPLTGPRHALTRELARTIRQLAGRGGITERHLAESLTTALRLHLIETFTAGSTTDDAFDDVTKERLLAYLDRGADVDTSQRALAHHLGMPVRAFARAFLAAYRTTPHQFVIDRRIARAKSLLRTSGESVTEIGLSVGFSTPSHFSTVFKNRTGVTPTQYRENPDRPTLHAGRSAGRSGSAPLPPIRRTRP